MRKILFLLVLAFSCGKASAQMQDSTSQVLFAKYLFEKGLFKFAAEEYERLHYYYPDNRFYLTSLFKAERFAGNVTRLEDRVKGLNYNDPTLSRNFFLTLVALDELDKAKEVVYQKMDPVSEPNIHQFKTGLLVLNRQEELAEDSIKSWQVNDDALYNLITMAKETKKKSPLAAGIMSAIIPSTGRIYAGDYKDGLFSLIFIGGTALQSYNRFNTRGIKSAGGWIYGGISMGFYLGNIWGSVKAAKRYNDKQYKRVYDETKNYFNSRFLD